MTTCFSYICCCTLLLTHIIIFSCIMCVFARTPTRILLIFHQVLFFMCVFTRSYTRSSQLLLQTLLNKVAQKNDFEPIYIRLTCRPSTLKMRNTSTAPNAIMQKDELERSTTGITRALLDASCSSCSLSNLLASHASQLLSISRVLVVVKQKNAIWLVTCIIIGRAKNLGLLGQILLTKHAIIYAVTIRLVICIMYVI